jgi:hypothetical protein
VGRGPSATEPTAKNCRCCSRRAQPAPRAPWAGDFDRRTTGALEESLRRVCLSLQLDAPSERLTTAHEERVAFRRLLRTTTEGVKKPDTRIYEIACTRLGVEGAHRLYIGDGASDELRGATAVGMRAVRLRPGDTQAPQWLGETAAALSEVPRLLPAWRSVIPVGVRQIDRKLTRHKKTGVRGLEPATSCVTGRAAGLDV